ncbi:transglutaminase family protein [Desulfopila sp. IMCC35006]|uniref:transglutaminase domain-containing protein n=1 Tax=Desulfopila sp. IMCC35006 TaxID=2569542 RepID=UPI0010ACD1E4|nr:transglutaminase family protein [Desulfopila sp. IMCC35006]TKB23641.1 transglutaminase family protein [Desulfopila sp. IMCC35006]
MRLRTGCDLTFEITVPTPFVLMLRPRSSARQWIASEKYTITPSVAVSEFTDTYGNLCQRLIAPPGSFSISTCAEVILADRVDRAEDAPFVEIHELPDDVLIYLLPSRYCETEHFGQMATAIAESQILGYNQVAAIESWVRKNIRFKSYGNDIPVSAVDVNSRQWGVCRDLSHLAIALCRSLSIPARMVVGYLYGLQPMDLHAWFEAYLAGRWYTFDATQAELQGGYVVLGYGRDAADVAVYNQFGPAVYPTTQSVRVERVDNAHL